MRTKQGGRGPVSFLAGCRSAMETEAGAPGSGSKKRKRPAMGTRQGGRGPGSVSKKRKLAPAETPAVVELRAAGDQGPLPESGKVGTDRISLISDAILGEIVSLLPTKEGARTQFLASRWRHVWRSTPLNLDCGVFTARVKLNRGSKQTENSDLDRVVSSILTSHQAPVRRLCIPTRHGCAEETVEAWLSSPTLDNLHELEFGYIRDYKAARPRRWWGLPTLSLPPASTFRFATTLRCANIGRCHLPDNIVQGLHFPQLMHLALQCVRISECSIHRLIAGCPALEFLMICYIYGSHCLRINSLGLRSIGVHTCFYESWRDVTWLEKLVIEDAPCLERLLRLDLFDGLQVSVISAPKLEILGFVNNNHPSYSGIIKGLSVDNLTTMVRFVTTLAINMHGLDLDTSIAFIRCLPCLEKLYIRNESMRVRSSRRPKNFWRRKHQNIIGYLDIRVKTIVLEPYWGIASEVNFVEFFVLNARELELVTFRVETIDDEFIAKQERLLQLEKKASSSARLLFTTDRCLRDVSNICHP